MPSDPAEVEALASARRASEQMNLRRPADPGRSASVLQTKTQPQTPLPRARALLAEVHCIAATIGMLARREVRQPHENLGRVIGFADGTSARVYRETVVERVPNHPCFLVVCFRLRHVRGRGHLLFRRESLLNTPLFVGFPGFVSKLWLTHDERSAYRGLYEWDGAEAAESYARSLWRVLELVSVPGTIHYRVLPGLRRDEVLADPRLIDGPRALEGQAWWRPVPVD